MGVSELANLFLVAVGFALAGGTGAALLTYRRTGRFPGQPATDDEGRPLVPSVRTAVVKVLIGAVLVLWGLSGYLLSR